MWDRAPYPGCGPSRDAIARGIGGHSNVTMLSTCEETGTWHHRAHHATPLLLASSFGKRSQGNLWHPIPLEVDISSGWLRAGSCGWCKGTLSPHPFLSALSGSSAVEAWAVPTLSPGKTKGESHHTTAFPSPQQSWCWKQERPHSQPARPCGTTCHSQSGRQMAWESWHREDGLGK